MIWRIILINWKIPLWNKQPSILRYASLLRNSRIETLCQRTLYGFDNYTCFVRLLYLMKGTFSFYQNMEYSVFNIKNLYHEIWIVTIPLSKFFFMDLNDDIIRISLSTIERKILFMNVLLKYECWKLLLAYTVCKSGIITTFSETHNFVKTSMIMLDIIPVLFVIIMVLIDFRKHVIIR